MTSGLQKQAQFCIWCTYQHSSGMVYFYFQGI